MNPTDHLVSDDYIEPDDSEREPGYRPVWDLGADDHCAEGVTSNSSDDDLLAHVAAHRRHVIVNGYNIRASFESDLLAYVTTLRDEFRANVTIDWDAPPVSERIVVITDDVESNRADLAPWMSLQDAIASFRSTVDHNEHSATYQAWIETGDRRWAERSPSTTFVVKGTGDTRDPLWTANLDIHLIRDPSCHSDYDGSWAREPFEAATRGEAIEYVLDGLRQGIEPPEDVDDGGGPLWWLGEDLELEVTVYDADRRIVFHCIYRRGGLKVSEHGAHSG